MVALCWNKRTIFDMVYRGMMMLRTSLHHLVITWFVQNSVRVKFNYVHFKVRWGIELSWVRMSALMNLEISYLIRNQSPVATLHKSKSHWFQSWVTQLRRVVYLKYGAWNWSFVLGWPWSRCYTSICDHYYPLLVKDSWSLMAN